MSSTMTKILATSLSLFLAVCVNAQSGCTDSAAVNFDPTATMDDGSCEVFNSEFFEDATLNIPISIGTGISNEHMTITRHGSIELGVKINERFVDDVIPVGTDYFISTGYSRTSFFDETPNPPNSKWDFIFSIDLGDYTYNDLSAFVSLDFDPVDGPTQAEIYNLDLSTNLQGIGLGGSSIRQQSDNLAFAFFQVFTPNATLFDALSPGVYDLGVFVENQGGTELARSSMRVIVGDAIQGCTDPAACNFNAQANLDDNTCEFPEEFLLCDGTCEHDFNSNGVCDEAEVYGCTYESAFNFNPAATADDGSCETGGSSCPGDIAPVNPDGSVGNGVINAEDLLEFFTLFGTTCQ